MGLFSDDGSYNEHTSIWKFYALIGEAAAKTGTHRLPVKHARSEQLTHYKGRVFDVATRIEPLLKGAGFHHIHVKMVKAPMGTWAADPKQKERGAYQQMASESGFEAIGIALLTRDMKMSAVEARALMDRARADLRNKKIHSYSKQ